MNSSCSIRLDCSLVVAELKQLLSRAGESGQGDNGICCCGDVGALACRRRRHLMTRRRWGRGSAAPPVLRNAIGCTRPTCIRVEVFISRRPPAASTDGRLAVVVVDDGSAAAAAPRDSCVKFCIRGMGDGTRAADVLKAVGLEETVLGDSR